MTRTSVVPLALVALLPLLGCDTPDPPLEQGAGGLELVPVDRSGAAGFVRADHAGDHVTVTLFVTGLEPGQGYSAHIHAGRCAAGGPVAVPLERITADEDGSGRSVTRVGTGQLDPAEPAFVQVDAPDGQAIACVDLTGHDGAGLTDRGEGAP